MGVLFLEKTPKNKVLQMHLSSLGIFKISFLAPLAHVLQSCNDLGKSSRKRQQEASSEAPQTIIKCLKVPGSTTTKIEADYLFAYDMIASAD